MKQEKNLEKVVQQLWVARLWQHNVARTLRSPFEDIENAPNQGRGNATAHTTLTPHPPHKISRVCHPYQPRVHEATTASNLCCNSPNAGKKADAQQGPLRACSCRCKMYEVLVQQRQEDNIAGPHPVMPNIYNPLDYWPVLSCPH